MSSLCQHQQHPRACDSYPADAVSITTTRVSTTWDHSPTFCGSEVQCIGSPAWLILHEQSSSTHFWSTDFSLSHLAVFIVIEPVHPLILTHISTTSPPEQHTTSHTNMADSESEPKAPGSIELIESTENAEKVTAPKASNLVSPPGSKTPPVSASKRPSLRPDPSSDKNQKRSESINADALSKALKEFEEVGRQRERTPGTSPSRKRQRVYGDRLVLDLSLG